MSSLNFWIPQKLKNLKSHYLTFLGSSRNLFYPKNLDYFYKDYFFKKSKVTCLLEKLNFQLDKFYSWIKIRNVKLSEFE